MKKTDLFIGLMSGTSLDGVDAVLVDFSSAFPKLVCSHTYEIPEQLKKQIVETIAPDWTGTLATVGRLNQQLGLLFANATNQLVMNSNIPPSEIKAIGSHGQTFWHHPKGEHPFSMQLGDASIIAEQTKITTIADFRSRDIAIAGQGAPLVPAFHQQMLTHAEEKRLILNIGGIANLSILPSSKSDEKVTGFDTGPGNGLIDAWTFKHKKVKFDEDGNWARSGNILPQLLQKLLNDPYFSAAPPKSTGKELFNLTWLKNILNSDKDSYKAEDIQATLTELTTVSISDNIKDCDELFICGGGMHNKYLLERIRHCLPDTHIDSTQALGIDPDWMEAMAFAWLAKRTLEGRSGNLPSATGAKGKRILGAIYQA